MDNNSPPILQYFSYDHLKGRLRSVSQRFHDLAHGMVETIPPGAELSAGLRKLLEAKDCAVRAAMAEDVFGIQGEQIVDHHVDGDGDAE